MALDFTNLSPEDIEQLKNLLGVKEDSTRSPMWKPLRDMRPPQTAKGRLNRPHFEWSADEPPEGVYIQPFPRLYWDQNGVERKINTADDLKIVGEGWSATPPMANAISDQDRLEMELAQLSPDDREFVLKATKTARLERLKEQMLGLSATDLAALTGKPEPVAEVKPAAKTEKVKTA